MSIPSGLARPVLRNREARSGHLQGAPGWEEKGYPNLPHQPAETLGGTRTSPLSAFARPLEDVAMGEDLTPTQRQEVRELVSQHQDVYDPSPGYTQLLHHNIVTPPGVRVRLKPYRLPEARRKAVEEAVAEMRRLNIIEESHSPCSSPIVADRKSVV